MARKASGDPQPLEMGVKGALEEASDEFEELLLAEAARRAAGGPITEAHVRQAFEHLLDPNLRKDVQAIISRALRENRAFEWLTYVMSLGLFALGAVLLGAGVLAGGDLGSRVPMLVGDSVPAVLLLPALRFAINSRRHNISIRIVGLLLDRAGDPKALKPLLKDLLLDLLKDKG